MTALKLRLTLVHWQDSLQTVPGWQYLTDLPVLAVAECQSVGWVVAEDSETLMIAQTLADPDTDSAQGAGFKRIPKRCITKRRVL